MPSPAFHIRHSSDATALLHSPELIPELRPKSRLAAYLQAVSLALRADTGGKYFNKLATLDLIDFHFESQIFQRAEKF